MANCDASALGLRRVSVLVALVAACTLPAGCSGGKDEPDDDAAPNIVQPGAPGQPSRTVSPEDPELDGPGYKAVDVRFVQGMIHHHAQALVMTALVPSRTTSTDLRLMARRIDVSQESEIELMQSWLRERNEEVPALHGHMHAQHMPGMATQAQLDDLEAARGKAFQRLFLELMIRHHEGALTMVRELRDAGGSFESEVDSLARHVESDQEIEILRMQELLRKLAR